MSCLQLGIKKKEKEIQGFALVTKLNKAEC